jgi:hypothetical protein
MPLLQYCLVDAGIASQRPSCQLTLRELDSRFGAVPRHSRFITDFSGRLSSRDMAELQALLRLFNRKFPQSRFSVFLSNQISAGSIGEYAFWLMNQARFGFRKRSAPTTLTCF